MTAAPGWYPDPSGAPGHRYWDGYRWTVANPTTPRWMSTTQKWWLFGGLTVGAIVSITLAGFLMYQDVRPVRSAHSDDPSIEAFYRELDAR